MLACVVPSQIRIFTQPVPNDTIIWENFLSVPAVCVLSPPVFMFDEVLLAHILMSHEVVSYEFLHNFAGT
jgi:hypothetical protein